MNLKKKLFAITLIVTLITGLMPLGVIAEEPVYAITLSVGSKTSDSVSLIANITEDGVPVSAGSISGTASYSGKSVSFSALTLPDAEISITGLAPETSYAFTVQADYNGDALEEDITVATDIAETAATVTTNSAAYDHGDKRVTADATINLGSYTLKERGFVYSQTKSEPSTSDSVRLVTGTGANYSVAFDVDAGKGVCYVRAYIITTEGGTVYGDVKIANWTAQPAVETRTATNIKANSATAKIYISSVGDIGITKSGIILSTYNNRLDVLDVPSNASQHDAGKSSVGEASISLTGLEAGVIYYYKAYVVAQGDYYYADEYESFQTLDSSELPTVTTGSIGSISGSSASVSINVSSVGGSNVTERGVVYSSTNSTPTLSDSYKAASSKGSGSVTIDLSSLSKNTTYYVRAYAQNSQGVAYGSVKTFTTSSSSNTPNANTDSIGDVTASTAEITFDISSGSGITERGVVYSTSVTSPEVGTSKCYTQKTSGTTGTTTVTLTGLSKDTKYYVRAYAKNSHGYGYGEVMTFTTEESDTIPSVTTVSASEASYNSIDVKINVTSDNGSTITERGVVYSRTDTNPKMSSRSCYYEAVSGRTGSTTVTLSDLTANSTYYVRAYAENKYGIAYGEVKEVDLGDSGYVSTNNVTGITATSATAGGYVPSSINSSVKERGVAYSTTNQQPTVSNGAFESSKTSSGDFTVNMTGLTSGRTYYVRAYIRTNDGYQYGSTVSFVTTGGNSNLLVLYRTMEGAQVATQTLTLSAGTVFDSSRMVIPEGYYPVDPFYSYMMSNSDQTITVTVKYEDVYMESPAGYRFEPEALATRIDVVKMIYALRGMPVSGTIKTFTDIPDDYQFKTALNYVTAKEYMVGDSDGTFRPNDRITRAEIAVICNTVFGFSQNSGSGPFSDISGHWAKNYIVGAYIAGAVVGYPDGTFKPEANITRAELCTLFANSQKRGMQPLGTAEFIDVPSDHWAYKYIMNAAKPQP